MRTVRNCNAFKLTGTPLLKTELILLDHFFSPCQNESWNYSCETANETHFHDRFCTRTRFETEAQANSEIVHYCSFKRSARLHFYRGRNLAFCSRDVTEIWRPVKTTPRAFLLTETFNVRAEKKSILMTYIKKYFSQTIITQSELVAMILQLTIQPPAEYPSVISMESFPLRR